MKINSIVNPNFGLAFKRIDSALHKYAPKTIQWVNRESEADVNLIHVVGGEELVKLWALKKPSIIVQHCYFTAGPLGDEYAKCWEKSPLTISFHNLPEYTNRKFNFYRTPWGYEESQFGVTAYGKRFNPWVFATGHVAVTENLDKIYEACKRSETIMFHTGEDFKYGSFNYRYLKYMDDTSYKALLNSVRYVLGLREFEGFEMACIEGAACGARPIVPALPTYDFYKGFGYFVNMSSNVVDQLIEYFKIVPPEFTPKEQALINGFNWKYIVPNIFSEIEKYAN